MAKGLVASKVYENASVLGLQNVREPLHMATAIISPCSKCHNPNCARNNPEMYESYSEETQKLFKKNSADNALPSDNPISIQDPNTRNIVMAFVALPYKNLFKAQDILDYHNSKMDSKHTSGKDTVNTLFFIDNINQFARAPFSPESLYRLHLVGSRIANVTRKQLENADQKIDNVHGVYHPWEVGELDLIQCEPFPVKFMFSLQHAQGEFSGELREADWITILYTGDAVYNGVFVPSAMYGGGLARQVDGATMSNRYPSFY